MKVLLPRGKELEGFERQLRTTLEQSNLSGCALMGFTFQSVKDSRLHEIDALVLIKPGIFICLEAKGYSGTWTGCIDGEWMSDGRQIKATKGNPYKQVNEYAWAVKDRLNQKVFNNVECYVNSFIVVPDSAKIEIQNAVIDKFQPGRAICICHCSKLEQVLGTIRPGRGVAEQAASLGLKQIISSLTGLSLEDLNILIAENSRPSDQPEIVVEPPSITPDKPTHESHNPKTATPRKSWSIAAGAIYAASVVAATALATQYFFGNSSCEVPTETRVDNICYKDLTRTPLRIGILSSPDRYENFRTYLKEQLGSQALEIVIEGNADISYTEAQNKIAKQEWDIIFAFSPMNGMRSKDNGYTWMARMFPQLPPTYQAALYVRANSRIQALNDIATTTTIALGDFNSASSFYMPVYDLYGKSMNATAGHRSSKIKDLVASGIVDMGAGVYSFIKDDPKFRVVHVSREIPGSGVYSSPKIAPKVQEQLRQIMMNAPEEIKEEANYGEGQEPNYEPFRAISLRADEVLGCADFDRQPVQFFCSDKNNQQAIQPQEKLTGSITGFTNEGNGMVRLRFEEKSGRICQLSVSLKTLSSVPNGTSPGMINRKQVSLTGVKLEPTSDSSCNLEITDPKQIVVF